MKIRTSVVLGLALSMLLVAGCQGTDDPPYGSTDVSVQTPRAGSGGSAWTNGGSGGSGQSKPAAAGASAATADVVLASGNAFKAYLADASGRALYMFANDVPGSSSSACAEACVDKWPVFDVKELKVGAGLTGSDFSRFLRADGSWQTAFKGHPLYRFAMDAAAGAVGGDGASGRWFVARDYLAFVAAKADLTPQGATAPTPYMTNRMGRTVYVFMNDTAGKAGTPPVSACADKCLEAWPTWNAPATLASLVLPSSMKAEDFDQFERVVAGATVKQLTYRGWPLYFHTPDDAPGETTGHLSGAWRAIYPASFSGAVATP